MKKFYLILAIILLWNCATAQADEVKDNLIVCNEGNWQSDNGQLSYYDATTGTLTNQWFRTVNNKKLGDTPNDILQINDNLIAICVNWSNIIQFINPNGEDMGATEDIPNNRRMCTDGNYLYVTSYAHTCGETTFTKGYVAKIDINTKKVVATCEVGWEPEGIRYYDGKLYVANTGGYSFSENHDYETTVEVVDANEMRSIKTIDTGCINLYGEMSQAGQYLCINSCGDYYEEPAKTVILDCETDEVKTFDFPCTYNTTDGEKFYTVGSAFSYITYEYVYYVRTIDPKTMTYSEGIYNDEVTNAIKSLTSAYELYISPYTKNIYFTDALSYASAGYLYGYTPEGTEVFEPQKVYINPAHILAIPTGSTAISTIDTDTTEGDGITYDILGRRVNENYKGIVIRNGKKYIQR
ncbi:MAG: YncE family protein [Muribaculaceae bacterium]